MSRPLANIITHFPIDLLARDARAKPSAAREGINFSVIINAESRSDVDDLVSAFRAAGGSVTKEPTDAEFFDGRSAYVTDPEGNFWEIAWTAGANAVVTAARRAAGLPTGRKEA